MNITTGVNVNGSCLQGYLDGVSFWELIDIFGEPTDQGSADGKTRVGWSIRFEEEFDNYTVSIYDWKTDEDLTEIRRWNVGGYDKMGYATLLTYVCAQLKEVRNEIAG